MIRRVLVPLDGSPAAEAALAHAVAIGSSFGAELCLLRVVEARGDLDPAVSAVDWRLQRVEATAYLQEVVERLESEGVAATAEVVEGTPADAVVRFVRGRAVDLVVLSSHGRGGATGAPFGGTVHKILSGVPASVMVVRAPAEAARPPGSVAYRRVLVPTDGSSPSEWALHLAATISRAHEAELLVLQVVPDVELLCARFPFSAEETELVARLEAVQRERGEGYFRELESQLGGDDLRARFRVVRAKRVSEGVRQVAGEEEVDLIALSAHGAAEVAFPYGKLVQHLLSHAPVSVLVLQDLPKASWTEERPTAREPGR